MATARRLIKLGKSSLAITLPKKWVGEQGLREGDLVIVDEQNGSLVISVARQAEPEPSRVAHVSAKPQEEESLERIIIALYQAGYDVIRVSVSGGRTTQALRDALRRTLTRLIGLEVVEEGSDYVLLQMVADAAVMSLDRVLGRMELLVLNSLRELEIYAAEKDLEILRGIVERDEEVDKFYFLLSRQVSLALRNPAYLKQIGVEDRPLLLPMFNYGKTIERVGDVAVAIARVAPRIEVAGSAIEVARRAIEAGVRVFRTGDDEGKRFLAGLYADYFSRIKPDSLLDHLIGNIISLSLDMVESRIEYEVLRERR
ncbi:MAG: phosphate uptake regulator PhoU [Thermofilum sp.]